MEKRSLGFRDLEEDVNGGKKLLCSTARSYRRGEAGMKYAINDKTGILMMKKILQIGGRNI